MKKGRNDTGKTKYDWQGDVKKPNADGAHKLGGTNKTVKVGPGGEKK